MSIYINRIADIDKLLAFLRVGGKGAFNVAAGLLKEVLERVAEWAKDKNIRVEFTRPDSAKTAAFTMAGGACGLAVGLVAGLAAVPLLAAGVAGAAAGYATAHVVLMITPAGAADRTTVTIA